MDVPSHQMHRVLKLYAKRLKRTAEARRHLAVEGDDPVPEIRRQSVVDRVAATIVQRILEIGPRLGAGRPDRAAGTGPARRVEKPMAWLPEFHFHRIDHQGRKRLATLSMDNGDFVFQRVEALWPDVPAEGPPDP